MMAVMAILAVVALSAQGGAGQRAGGAPAAPPLTMAIAAFPDGGQIPVKYSQAAPGAAPGEGTSPAITWTNVPPGTQSFFLNMHDMEVVRNKTTDDQAHWVVWNIPGTSTGLPEGVAKGAQLPDGSYQISATGLVYRGPGAPANGPQHHYMLAAPVGAAQTVRASRDVPKRRQSCASRLSCVSNPFEPP